MNKILPISMCVILCIVYDLKKDIESRTCKLLFNKGHQCLDSNVCWPLVISEQHNGESAMKMKGLDVANSNLLSNEDRLETVGLTTQTANLSMKTYHEN